MLRLAEVRFGQIGLIFEDEKGAFSVGEYLSSALI
jgi:hypothetical protein